MEIPLFHMELGKKVRDFSIIQIGESMTGGNMHLSLFVRSFWEARESYLKKRN